MRTAPLDHESLRTVLETSGLRCTAQRIAVYDYLTCAAHHPTAEDVYHAVRSIIPKISLATVYKALESLVATGAATKLTTGAGAADTRARYDARPDLHYHFRCLRTGEVHDLPTPFDPALISKLDPQLASYLSRQGFQVTGYRLELVGYQDGLPAVSGIGEDPSSNPNPGPRPGTIRQDPSTSPHPLDESDS
jgi:Fur family transcriptional regulator, peroxide stress response regulator